jgi:excisionase family DNA binding protein
MEVVMTHSPLAPLRYSLREVEKLLGLSRSTLYARIAEGKLAIQKDGRRTFVSAVELNRYMLALETSAKGDSPFGLTNRES